MAKKKRIANKKSAKASGLAAKGPLTTMKEIAPRTVEQRVEDILKALKRLSSKRVLEEMSARYGIHTEKAFGVPMGAMQRVARNVGPSHELALALWETGWYEARMVASLIDEPGRVTPAQMDRWRRDFDNWGVCDTVCFKLFDRTPHAFGRVEKWAALKDEFGKRAAFALLACLALHDKEAGDDAFVRLLPLVEAGASDDRNFVKKGVSWALRSIGMRSPALHARAIALARKLSESDNPGPRWVGKDALRDLGRPVVARRLERKGKAKR